MLEQLSTTNQPTATNKRYFNDQGGLMAKYLIWGVLAQIISGVTEALGVGLFMYSVLSTFLPPTLSAWVAGGIGLVFALFMELFIRSSLTTHTRTWYHRKEQLNDGIDWFIFGIGLGILVIFVCLSAFASKQGAHFNLEANMPTYQGKSIAPIVDEYEVELERLQNQYQADKDLIMSNYNGLESAAIDAEFQIRKGLENDVAYWKKQEQLKGKSFTSKIQAIQDQIDESHKRQTAEVKKLYENKKSELDQLLASKDAKEQAIRTTKATKEENVGNENGDGKATWDAFVKWFAWLISLVATCSVLMFVPVQVSYTLWAEKAGLETRILVPEEFFESNLAQEFTLLLQMIFARPIRWGVRTAINSFPNLPEIKLKLFYTGEDYQFHQRKEKRTGPNGSQNDDPGGGGRDDDDDEKSTPPGGSNGVDDQHQNGVDPGGSNGVDPGHKNGVDDQHQNGVDPGGSNGVDPGHKNGVDDQHHPGDVDDVDDIDDDQQAAAPSSTPKSGRKSTPKRGRKSTGSSKKTVRGKSLSSTAFQPDHQQIKELLSEGFQRIEMMNGEPTIIHVDRQTGEMKKLNAAKVASSISTYKHRHEKAEKEYMKLMAQMSTAKSDEEKAKINTKIEGKIKTIQTNQNGWNLYMLYRRLLDEMDKGKVTILDQLDG